MGVTICIDNPPRNQQPASKPLSPPHRKSSLSRFPNDAAPPTKCSRESPASSIERKTQYSPPLLLGPSAGLAPSPIRHLLIASPTETLLPFVPHDSTHCFLHCGTPLASTRLRTDASNDVWGDSSFPLSDSRLNSTRCTLLDGRSMLILVDGNTEPTTESSPHQPPGPGTNPL
jgi:hypothetical protein